MVKAGDLAISLRGRDKGLLMLVIDANEKFVYVVDGKTRKVLTPKKKNKKHLRIVIPAYNESLAEKILKGQAVGNQRISRLIKAEKQKIQED